MHSGLPHEETDKIKLKNKKYCLNSYLSTDTLSVTKQSRYFPFHIEEQAAEDNEIYFLSYQFLRGDAEVMGVTD